MKPSGSSSNGLMRGQSTGGLTIPQDYERLVGTDFVIGAKKDLDSIEMLEAQVGPWIAALKKKIERLGTSKPQANQTDQ